MSRSPPLNPLPVEVRLSELLGPLDHHLELGRTFLAAALVLSPAPLILLWLLKYIEAKHAAGWSVLAFGTLVVLGLSWEMLLGWWARRRFDQRFPHGSPDRASALRLLALMETPSKVEEKLREALGATARTVNGQKHLSPTNPPIPHLELPPEVPAALPQTPPATPTAPRPGGYYDYIPLEPLGDDEARPRG